MSDASPVKTARIRELNDQLRCKGSGGRIVITRGIAALGIDTVRHILLAVAQFDGFTADNDPWGEHDCAVLSAAGYRIIFKLDYFDRELESHSPDASDPAVSERVMTLMLADE